MSLVPRLMTGTGGGMNLTPLRDLAVNFCERRGLTLQELRSHSRIRIHTHPRQDFMAEAYATGRWSMTQIANFLDGRDHQTIIWGIRQSKKRAAQVGAGHG